MELDTHKPLNTDEASLPKSPQEFRPSTFIKHGVSITVGYMEWVCYIFHSRCTPVMFTYFTSKESFNTDNINFLRDDWKPKKSGLTYLCDACGRDLFLYESGLE